MYLLDTNHCSRLLDGHPALIEKLEKIGDVEIFISVIVRGELIYMVEQSEQRRENAAKVSAFLKSITILPVDNATADVYGGLKSKIIDGFGPRARARRKAIALKGLGFSENDLWIAATAIAHELILVSEDSDYNRIRTAAPNLRLENWLT